MEVFWLIVLCCITTALCIAIIVFGIMLGIGKEEKAYREGYNQAVEDIKKLLTK